LLVHDHKSSCSPQRLVVDFRAGDMQEVGL